MESKPDPLVALTLRVPASVRNLAHRIALKRSKPTGRRVLASEIMREALEAWAQQHQPPTKDTIQ